MKFMNIVHNININRVKAHEMAICLNRNTFIRTFQL